MVAKPLLLPADIIQLPKGQAFALLEGGKLWKIRMPLPAAEADALMPPDLQKIAQYMEKNYRTGETWWTAAPFSDAQHGTGGMTVAEMTADTKGGNDGNN